MLLQPRTPPLLLFYLSFEIFFNLSSFQKLLELPCLAYLRARHFFLGATLVSCILSDKSTSPVVTRGWYLCLLSQAPLNLNYPVPIRASTYQSLLACIYICFYFPQVHPPITGTSKKGKNYNCWVNHNLIYHPSWRKLCGTCSEFWMSSCGCDS